MEVIHKLKRGEIRGEGSSFLFLSDRNGGYFSLGSPSDSNYNGWFVFLEQEWELYKIIEDIKLDFSPQKIVNYGNNIQRLTGKTIENIEVEKNFLLYNISNYIGEITLELDFRRIHDYDDKGRIYKIYEKDGCTIINYKKYYDNSLETYKEEFFLAIHGNVTKNISGNWIHKNYPYDEKRNVKSNFYVYEALKMRTVVSEPTTIKFGFGKTEQQSIENCNKATSKNKITLTKPLIKSEVPKDVLDIAINAFKNLQKPITSKQTSIFAGFPWFYQIWSRDELISVTGLIQQGKLNQSEGIVLRHLGGINEQGIIGNRWPSSDLGSADGTGWLYKRIHDLMNVAKFTGRELREFYSKLCHTIEKTRNTLLQDGLIYSGSKETWMDTTTPEGEDTREGYRIEIQALHLIMYRLAYRIGKLLQKDDFRRFAIYEAELKKNVLKYLFKEGILHDGLNKNRVLDKTTRPNIFLAYYIFPDLMLKEEWKKTFNKILDDCWLEWGGMSSISKNNHLFCKEHTGVTNRSYHRGDSWYFVNNITGICLHHLDKVKYKNYIEKIRSASIHEMLFTGFIGQCAEISDAKEQSSKGCRAQAWSAATLIELINQTTTDRC